MTATRKRLAHLEHLRKQRLAARADRFLARIFLRLLDEPEFLGYLRTHWDVQHEIDPTTQRIHVHVERVAAGGEPEEPSDGRAQS